MSEQNHTSVEVLSRLREIEEGVVASVGVLRGLERQVDTVRLQIQNAVQQHQQGRRKYLERSLQERKSTWCTGCLSIVPEAEVVLCLVQGVNEVSGGYENSMYGFEDFSSLHRVCFACRKRFADKHGWQAEHREGRRACFYAFDAEMREDGLWARKFGGWELVKSESWVDVKGVCLERVRSAEDRLFEAVGTPPSLEVVEKGLMGTIVRRGGLEIARSGF